MGEQYAYSSYGIALAGAVVEAVTGRKFGEYARTAILERLGMESTAWPDSPNWDSVKKRRATGYMRFGEMVIPTPRIESGTYQSTGLITCMGDHTRLLVAMMNGGKANGVEVLRPESLLHLLAPRGEAKIFGFDFGYMGLSVEMQRAGERVRAFGHGGQYPFGWQAQSWVYLDPEDRERDFAIAVGTNDWDMTRYLNPPERSPTGILVHYAAECMGAGRVQVRAGRRPGDASYAMGSSRPNGCLVSWGWTEGCPRMSQQRCRLARGRLGVTAAMNGVRRDSLMASPAGPRGESGRDPRVPQVGRVRGTL